MTSMDTALTTGEIEAIGLSHGRLSRLDGRAARFLRAVSGCDEDVLRACPEERFKFSGFGAVIIGTASMAAVSMTMALSIVFAAPIVATAPGGLLWGGFVLVLDRWLISTGRGWKHVLPRVVIAAFFGLIIAEPLVLLAFDDAIAQEIATDVTSNVREVRANWERCNPTISDAGATSVPETGCDGYGLSAVRPTTATLDALDDDHDARWVMLNGEVDAQRAKLETLAAQLQDEANGEEGAHLSGLEGDGPRAARVQQEIEDVEELMGVTQAELADLRSEREDAELTLATYNEQRTEEIGEKVRMREAQLTETPGLSRRMDALTSLMVESPTIGVARIVLTLFLVAIDTMPALVRSSSSGGAYDRIMALRQARSIETEHVRHTLVTERRRTRERTERARILHDAEALERKLDLDRQLDLARLDHQVETELGHLYRSPIDER